MGRAREGQVAEVLFEKVGLPGPDGISPPSPRWQPPDPPRSSPAGQGGEPRSAGEEAQAPPSLRYHSETGENERRMIPQKCAPTAGGRKAMQAAIWLPGPQRGRFFSLVRCKEGERDPCGTLARQWGTLARQCHCLAGLPSTEPRCAAANPSDSLNATAWREETKFPRLPAAGRGVGRRERRLVRRARRRAHRQPRLPAQPRGGSQRSAKASVPGTCTPCTC